MANRDMHNNILPAVAFNTQAISSDTTTNGTEVDLQGFESLEFIIQSGTITDGTYTPLVEESDTSGSGYTAVADTDLLGTEADAAFAAADDNVTKRIGYIGFKPYVRLSIVSASTNTGGTLSASAIKGHPLIKKTDGNS